MENRAQPNAFQSVVPGRHTRNDPLGVTDPQVHTAEANPRDKIKSDFGGHPPPVSEVHRDRMRSKMVNAFSLAYNTDNKTIEAERAGHLSRVR